jgi:hypothetical protein
MTQLMNWIHNLNLSTVAHFARDILHRKAGPLRVERNSHDRSCSIHTAKAGGIDSLRSGLRPKPPLRPFALIPPSRRCTPAPVSRGRHFCAPRKMAERLGFEPEDHAAQEFDPDVKCKSGKPQTSPGASLNSANMSPDLAEIVAAWPKLPPEIRSAILTLIGAVRKGS